MPAGERPCGGPGHTGHGTVGSATAWPPGRAFVAGLGSCRGCCWALRPCTDLSLNAKHERSRGPSHHRRLCCPSGSSGTTTPSDSLVAARPFPALAGYRQALLPEPRRLGATEGLSSSHDTLPTVPRPLRRRVPWHPLQALRCRPWPSPSEYRLGSLLAACAVIPNDAAGFASCCGPVGCPPRTGAVFLRFDPGISPDAGSAATGDPGVSPDRTHTGWLP